MSEVAKSGPLDPPGADDRAALTGAARKGSDRRSGRGARGARPASAESYYGRPIVKEPTWKTLDIAGYFFLGGLAGGSSMVAAGVQFSSRPAMARASKRGALAAIGLSVVALIHDLGKPSRFYNMLRVFKPTSPMSMGSWLLGVYVPLNVLAALDSAVELPAGLGGAGTYGAGLLGPAVASYTAVLAADTAVPAWHDGRRELPFVFVSSAACAASGLALIASPVASAEPVRRLALGAAAFELAAEHRLEASVGLAAECYREGRAGRLMKISRALSIGGSVGATLWGRHSRPAAAASGLALLAGSACTRFGVFEAGRASVRDPRYVVEGQRGARAAGRSAS
ncbi:MAG: polysulfide reductase NrfD [Solirubrobacteraceae bacterium]